jgi:hypothetical protein
VTDPGLVPADRSWEQTQVSCDWAAFAVPVALSKLGTWRLDCGRLCNFLPDSWDDSKESDRMIND